MRISRRGDWLNPYAFVAAVAFARRSSSKVRRGGYRARRGDCFAGGMRCFAGGGDSIVLAGDNSTIRRTLCYFLQKINYHLLYFSRFGRIFA